MPDTTASVEALIKAVERYERLLTMNMSELERQYIQMRLCEKRLDLALLRSDRLLAAGANAFKSRGSET